MARATLDKRPGDVAAMFDDIAGRYDLLNDILSAGQVRLWRRAVARITAAGPAERVLDLAAGTGTSSVTFTAAGADCVACDFSLGMLQVGRRRLDASRSGGTASQGPLRRMARGASRAIARPARPAATGGAILRRAAQRAGGLKGGSPSGYPPREMLLRGRRRAAAAVPRRGVRRGDDLVRPAQRGQPGGGAGGDAPGDASRRAAGGLRVQHDHGRRR